MFGMFTTGRPSEAATPPPEPVIAEPSTTCCEHCRLRPRPTLEQRRASMQVQPSERPRFDVTFEEEGAQLAAADRTAQERLREIGSKVSRLESLLSRMQNPGVLDRISNSTPSWRRPDPEIMIGQMSRCQADLKAAQGQRAYAEKTAATARLRLNVHHAERARRVRALGMARIAERDKRRAAAREAAGIAPPEGEVEIFTIADPYTVRDHLKSGQVTR